MGIVLMKIDTLTDEETGRLSEDALLNNNPLFGVFDGATSLVPYRDKQGRTGAYLAAQIARATFEHGKKPLEELANETNGNIRTEMKKKGINTSKKENLWGTTAAAIKLGKESFEYVQIGDSLILAIYNDNSYKLVVDYHDHDKEVLTKWKKLADKKTKNISEAINGDLVKLRRTSNKKYGVINGEKVMAKFLNAGTESLQNVKHILLFTDGLILPKENPKDKADFDTFVKLYLEGGLMAIKDFVREKETKDPDCWKYPRYKKHDDIAAIAITP